MRTSARPHTGVPLPFQFLCCSGTACRERAARGTQAGRFPTRQAHGKIIVGSFVHAFTVDEYRRWLELKDDLRYWVKYTVDGLAIDTATCWQLCPIARPTLAIMWPYLSRLDRADHAWHTIKSCLQRTDSRRRFPSSRVSHRHDGDYRAALLRSASEIPRDTTVALQWLLDPARRRSSNQVMREHSHEVWALLSAREKTSDGVFRLLLRYGLDPERRRAPDAMTNLREAIDLLHNQDHYGCCVWTGYDGLPSLSRSMLNQWVTLSPDARNKVFSTHLELCDALRRLPAGTVRRAALKDGDQVRLIAASREVLPGGHAAVHRRRARDAASDITRDSFSNVRLVHVSWYLSDTDMGTTPKFLDANGSRLELGMFRGRLSASASNDVQAALDHFFDSPEDSVQHAISAAIATLAADRPAVVIPRLVAAYERASVFQRYADLRDYVKRLESIAATAAPMAPASIRFFANLDPARHGGARKTDHYKWDVILADWNRTPLRAEHVVFAERLQDTAAPSPDPATYEHLSLAWHLYNHRKHFRHEVIPPSLRATLQYLTRVVLTALPHL